MSWENILKTCERGASQDLAGLAEEILSMVESNETVADYSSVILDFAENLATAEEQDIYEAFHFIPIILQEIDRLGKVGPGFIGEMLDKLGRIREEYNQCKLS